MTLRTREYTEYLRACLTLGYVSAILTGLSLPVCIVVGIYLNERSVPKIYSTTQTQNPLIFSWPDGGAIKPFASWEDVRTMSTTNVILYILLVIMGVSFIMSVILIGGAKEKNAGMIKSYCNFGTFLSAMIITQTTRVIRMLTGDVPWYAYLLICIFLAIYLPILFMVYETYKSLEASAPETNSSSNKITKEDEV